MTSLTMLTGSVVSLAGRLAATRHHPDEPSVGQVICKDVTYAQVLGNGRPWFCGAGRDLVARVASDAAVGEAFERYGLRDLDASRTLSVSMSELRAQRRRYLDPSELAPAHGTNPVGSATAFHPPPGADTAVRWMTAVDLVSGEDVLVPAQYCIFVEPHCGTPGCLTCAGDPGEPQWCAATSQGTAAGTNPAEACLSALLELFERDAFMLMWYHRLRFPYLRVDRHQRLGQRISAVFDPARIDVRFIDLTEVHGVPVVVGVARGRLHDREVLVVSAGSALDPETAVWKAARELAGLYPLARHDVLRGGARIEPEDILTLTDRLRYYTNPAHRHELDFLFEQRESIAVPKAQAVPGGTPAKELRKLTRRLHRRGIHTYAVDLTPAGMPPDLHSFKVVSPELIPLDNDHQNRHVNRTRLITEPTDRGWRPDRPTLGQLNHAPHPFP